MNKTALKRLTGGVAIFAGLSSLSAVCAAGGLPPPLPPVHYAGLINDVTPASVKNGPYEMHGKWTLDLDRMHGTARFSAELDMETSDYGITEGIVDKDVPTSRGAHTHHILVSDGVINPDFSACPAFSPAMPAAIAGFMVTGPAFITVNGGKTPFANPSSMTICVLGGEFVQFSNITLAIGAPANGHFGTYPIHGVVIRCAGPWELESKDCTLIPE
jgi:hypothetical protein